MQTLSHRVDLPPESPSTWILFVETELGADFTGMLGVQDLTGTTVSPDHRLMEGQKLEEALAPYLDRLEIVISDWRALHAPIEAFRRPFPTALAKRVVDTMFLPELTNSSWSDYHSALATRYACLRLWLDRRRPHAGDQWIAIEQGWQLDTWPARERKHVIIGTLAQPQVLYQVLERLKAHLGTGSANSS